MARSPEKRAEIAVKVYRALEDCKDASEAIDILADATSFLIHKIFGENYMAAFSALNHVKGRMEFGMHESYGERAKRALEAIENSEDLTSQRRAMVDALALMSAGRAYNIIIPAYQSLLANFCLTYEAGDSVKSLAMAETIFTEIKNHIKLLTAGENGHAN